MVSALDRRLVRDLGRLKGQVITIALVVACGIASYITMRGNYASITYARAQFDEHYRFADVFARLKRGPEALRARLESIVGVSRGNAHRRTGHLAARSPGGTS